MAATTARLLRDLAKAYQINSGRKLAKLLEVTPQAISLQLSGQRTMGADTALRVCELLQLDAADTLRDLQHERERRRKKGSARGSAGSTSNVVHYSAALQRQRRLF
jgi:plasmid maintenance system antidote protein VapI